MSGSYRLLQGGRVDRERTIAFTFDGQRYTGLAGDSLASALLANGVHLLGRSFKYHRPRGLLAAGSEEPNALVQLEGPDGRSEPNMRATQIELYDGLVAKSQNRWPSLAFDMHAINDLFSPLFPAGFYYKTFMWPARAWPFYEHVIRRIAGLGRAPTRPDPDRYAHCHAHCDVLVVGGGPAGLMAARAAAAGGARVILADEQAELGGGLLCEDGPHLRIDGLAPAEWLARELDLLAAMPELRLLPRTTAIGHFDHGYVTLVERVADHLPPGSQPDLPRQRLWFVRARRVVLATGAIERPLLFAGNDRPGVMLAGAVRHYLVRHAVRPGSRAVVVTSDDSAYATALALDAAGVDVAGIVDLRQDVPGAWPTRARDSGLRVRTGHAVVDVLGRRRVEAVRIMRLAGDGKSVVGVADRVACDLVAMSGGWNPAVHLHSQARGSLRFDDARGVFLPEPFDDGPVSVGAANGARATAECLREGARAGMEAAVALGFPGALPDAPDVAELDPGRHEALRPVPARGDQTPKKAFVDFQNDVTAADVELALREGFASIEHLKRYTTTGMGTDQGKTSNVNALALAAATLARPVAEIGTTTFRPPYTPVSFGAIAGPHRGALFEPIRHTAIHDWHERAEAVFEDVGQWKRPWYYPRRGEDMHGAVQRECKAVRESVGILDASTLGKIDLQGPDAVTLLERIYTNVWAKLGIGRCRYGLMLREDGMVLDDGVTMRLGEHHFSMTTTTGGAARVLAWLEEWLQTEWPDLRVFATSVTEQWATMTLSGPKARAVMAALTDDIDLAPDAFPFMAMREGRVAGVEARVARIGFTGELSFEINVPAGYGLSVWEACIAAGEAHGITPYGTETMHVLRAEKGFIIVGQETDGTVTPIDLGMEWIVSRQKGDFVGKRSLMRSLMRSDMQRDDRKQLVGLLPLDPEIVLEEGAQLVAEADAKPPVGSQGHVTSSYMSPNLGRGFALAMVKGGRARIGQRLHVAMPERSIPVEVTGPVFVDPDGERMRG